MKKLTTKFVLMICASGIIAPAMATAAEQEQISMDVIRGAVWYRERMALPPGSELLIRLEDVAKMDVKAEEVASQRQAIDGAPPYSFELSFDPGKLHDMGRYALRARIENNGQLLFINTSHVPAFATNRYGVVEIRVDRVPGRKGTRKTTIKPDANLTNTYWKLVEIDDQPVRTEEKQREAQIVLQDDGDMRGFTGCNMMRGSYILGEEGAIHFPPAMVTQRACIDGMDTEQAFTSRLMEVRRHTIDGDSMAMYSGDERLVLRFEAVYLY